MLLIFLMGVAVGNLLMLIALYISSKGTLQIDHSNSEKDRYRIVFDDLDELENDRFLILKVQHNVDLSQK